MTDSDVLVRAAKALREAHTGHRQGSGFTRARIMNTVHRERRRRVLRWAVFSPIASVLLVGSAWAQSTGKWPVIWKAVAAVFSAAPVTEAPPAPPKPKRAGSSTAREGLDDSPAEAPPPELVGPDAAVPAAPEPVTPSAAPREDEGRPVRPRSKRRQAPRSSLGDTRVERAEPPPSEPEPEPARDRELSRFRAAHDLHFSGDRPRAAIEAYSEYLREFPNGRFVPEARYNLALDQIKLGNDEAARAALMPFAAGKFGGYRQAEARELLQALDRKETGQR